MYRELGVFLGRVVVQKSFWKDGDFLTAVAVGVAGGLWCHHNPGIVPSIRQHFAHLLPVTAIIFGFAVNSLTFSVQTTSSWATDPKIQNIGRKLVDRHVWTILCLLFLIGYILVLWSLGRMLNYGRRSIAIEYGLLAFLIVYPALQILNHALTIWWTVQNRERLKAGTEAVIPSTEKVNVSAGHRVLLFTGVGSLVLAMATFVVLWGVLARSFWWSLLCAAIAAVCGSILVMAGIGIYGTLFALRAKPDEKASE